jgi:hypothetical protein
MAWTSEMFDRITDKIVAILSTDADLNDGLTTEVQVHKGVRKQGPEAAAIYVFRAGVDSYGYWMGEDGTDIVAVWGLAIVCRHLGDPEALEKLLATILANTARVMFKHKGEAGYWDSAVLQGSDAVSFRDDLNQTWEMETVLVRVSFESSDD